MLDAAVRYKHINMKYCPNVVKNRPKWSHVLPALMHDGVSYTVLVGFYNNCMPTTTFNHRYYLESTKIYLPNPTLNHNGFVSFFSFFSFFHFVNQL
jgi:hypothetical protein